MSPRCALSLFLLVLAFPACGKKAEKKAAAQAAPPPAVQIGPTDAVAAALGRIENGPALSGTLTAKREATLRAEIAGGVVATYAREGQQVSAGALLARLDPGSLGDAAASARLAVTNARSSLQVAERQEERQRTLLAAGAVAQREVETAHQSTVAARAAVAQAEAQLSSARKQLGNAEVRAPFAGVVSEKQVSIGDVVQVGGALYTVVDPSSLELEAAVPATALADLAAGMPVQFSVTGFPDRRFTGRVARINPSADPETRQVRVYAEIPNYERALVGGLFAEGRVATRSLMAVTLPAAAIDRRLGKPAVLKVQSGKVQRVEVALGLTDEQTDRVEIKQGVAAGDLVLVGAAQQIAPGTPVRLDPRLQAGNGRAG